MQTLLFKFHFFDDAQRIIPVGSRPVVGTRSTFDAIEQVEFVVGWLFDFFAGQRKGFSGRGRRYHEWGDQYQQFLLDAAMAGVTEERSKVGQVTQSWNARRLGVERNLEEAG
jgi:hypothetical protein